MRLTGLVWELVGAMLAVCVVAALLISRKRPLVYSDELPRIYELRGLDPNPDSPECYFRNLGQSLSAQKLKQFRDLERELQSLDPSAWAFLKTELAPLLRAKDPARGWQALWDKLNQAKAYNYLKRSGYNKVAFIAPLSVTGKKTPDLQARNGEDRALCEVKTINASEIEAERRRTFGVGTVEDQLNEFFFKKLASTLLHAKMQIESYDPSNECKKIVYLIINYDDSLHEYGSVYRLQIEQYLIRDHPVPGLHVELDIKEPFYTALSE